MTIHVMLSGFAHMILFNKGGISRNPKYNSWLTTPGNSLPPYESKTIEAKTE
jgi:hypothetical protein